MSEEIKEEQPIENKTEEVTTVKKITNTTITKVRKIEKLAELPKPVTKIENGMIIKEIKINKLEPIKTITLTNVVEE